MKWRWIKIKWIRFVMWQFYDYVVWGKNRRNRVRMVDLGEKLPDEYSFIKNYPKMFHTFEDVKKEVALSKKGYKVFINNFDE